MQKIKYPRFIYVLLVAALASCSEEEADVARISLNADKLQVSTGETVTFTVKHSAMAVTLFTGDEGHDFQSSATHLLSGKTNEDLMENNYRPIDPDVVPYNDLPDVVDANGGWSLIGSEAEIVSDPSLQKDVLKVTSTHPDWWYQALRLNVNSKLGTNKTLTLRMRFEKDVLEDIYSGDQHPEISTFPVVIRLAGKGAGDTEPIFRDETVWDIYWNPSLTYVDYSVDLGRIIPEWQTGTGKTMTELSYIQILFTASGSIGYVGDYFVESATYGDIDYIPFATGQALPVNDRSGVITYEYSYTTPGTYKVVAIGSNVSLKNYSGDGYKDDRDDVGADEYNYNTQYSSVEIVVNP